LAVSLIDYKLCIFDYLRAMATMRSKYIPEEARATIMNYFRIPLNLIVVVILLKDFHIQVIFMSCVFFLGIAAASMYLLYKLTSHNIKPSSPAVSVLATQQEKMLHVAHSSADGNEQMGTTMA